MMQLRQDGLTWHVAGDDVVVLDLEGSVYLKLNGSGRVLWERLAEPCTEAELIGRSQRAVRHRPGTSRHRCRRLRRRAAYSRPPRRLASCATQNWHNPRAGCAACSDTTSGDPHDAPRGRRDRRRRAVDPLAPASSPKPHCSACRLNLAPAPAHVEQLRTTELSRRLGDRCAARCRVADVWPFSKGPCLRRSLVAGHLLRAYDPALRLGS